MIVSYDYNFNTVCIDIKIDGVTINQVASPSAKSIWAEMLSWCVANLPPEDYDMFCSGAFQIYGERSTMVFKLRFK